MKAGSDFHLNTVICLEEKMFEKLEYCPECDEELRQYGYDFQYCWICGWGVKERGPYCVESDNQSIQQTEDCR